MRTCLVALSVLLLPGCDRGASVPGDGASGGGSAESGAPGAGPGKKAGPDPQPDSHPRTDPARPGKSGPRVVMVSPDHPHHGRLEGTDFPNDCTTDADCHAGGCSNEVCSAEEGVMTTCEVLPVQWPEGRACGCVEGTCVWWHASDTLAAPAAPKKSATGVDPNPARDAESGESCGNRKCKPGETCIEYYGIAGPSGPAFRECGIRCKPGNPASCPEGMRCVPIADGPGPVCRPAPKRGP